MDFTSMIPASATLTPAVEDVAADFVEQEIGRHDWMKNWQSVKDKEDVVKKVSDWATGFAMRVDPEAVVAYVDSMAVKGGPWL